MRFKPDSNEEHWVGTKRVSAELHDGNLKMAMHHDDRRAMESRGDVWTARIVTLFPEAFPGTLGCSIIGKALSDGIWSLEIVNLRESGIGRHKDVDDTPAGGGAGMVIRPDVIGAALDSFETEGSKLPIFCLSARGVPFTQSTAENWACSRGVTLLCGRFEGIDQRVLDHYGIEEISAGDYVLSGGEIAAQALIEATVRLIPRVLGNQESAASDSFSADGLLEYPQYTRPQVWRGRSVPEVLVSGHHGRIANWRREQSENLTRARRPDLWKTYIEGRGNRAEN